jgi:thiamine biosynthesis lipoprotein
MATEFRITIYHPEPRYASQAASAAFAELDLLENELSRFVEHSDISRINRFRPAVRGSSVRRDSVLNPARPDTVQPQVASRIGASSTSNELIVSPNTWDCLQASLKVEEMTGGLFNIAFRSWPICQSSDAIQLLRHPPRVLLKRRLIQLDLGGIGKGFALDRMACLFNDWEIRCFQLAASDSTVLLGDAPPHRSGWSIRVGLSERARVMNLARCAVSGSGVTVQGNHIFDPATGAPNSLHRIVWSHATTATYADALSTSFMLMDRTHITRFCQRYPEFKAFVVVPRRNHVVRIPEDA